jgi:hypothetical protein
MTLRSGHEPPSFALHARGPWYLEPSVVTCEALDLPAPHERKLEEERRRGVLPPEQPLGGMPRLILWHEGELLTTPDPGFEPRDRVRFPISSGGEVMLGSLCATTRRQAPGRRRSQHPRAALEGALGPGQDAVS